MDSKQIAKGRDSFLVKSKSMTSFHSKCWNAELSATKCGVSARRRSLSDSESSVEICVVSDCESSSQGSPVALVDSGIGDRVPDALTSLERKLDTLSELCSDQTRLLTSIKEEISIARAAIERSKVVDSQTFDEALNNVGEQRNKEQSGDEAGLGFTEVEATVESRARRLLDAIESRQRGGLEREVRDALRRFLQSRELKEQIVFATTASVRGVIRGQFSRELTSRYVPLLERAHRRLLSHVTRSLDRIFYELEGKQSQLFDETRGASRELRRALERHRMLLINATTSETDLMRTLQADIANVLEEELKQWRQQVSRVLYPQEEVDELVTLEWPLPLTPPPSEPSSPPQPADPHRSVIDQLMTTAEIRKQMAEGDISGAFCRALCAADLSLVAAACRAADPATACAALPPPTLLALVQQLATDMVHETQLKCSYLEEAMITLNTWPPATRVHLPVALGEARTHLVQFLTKYPGHFAARRVKLIVMAANFLLK